MSSRQPQGSDRRTIFRRLIGTGAMLVAVALFAPGQARANCSLDRGNSPGTYSVSVPETIINDPNISIGSVLYTSLPTGINHQVNFSCNGSGNRWGLDNNVGNTPATNVNTFPIGASGVSYRVLQSGSYIYPYPYFSLDSGNSWYENDAVTIELVKTGPIADGTTIQGSLADFKAGKTGGSIVDAVINLAGAVTFTAPACQVTTSNIIVTLPTVTSQAFSGVNSVTGTTPFQIKLTCSSGATLRMTLDTATPVAGKTGVIAPSGGASGVGVQLLDSSGVTPVQFGTVKTIGATPTGQLSINYFARYYQTGSTVGAGLLSATATFTLSYQ